MNKKEFIQLLESIEGDDLDVYIVWCGSPELFNKEDHLDIYPNAIVLGG